LIFLLGHISSLLSFTTPENEIVNGALHNAIHRFYQGTSKIPCHSTVQTFVPVRELWLLLFTKHAYAQQLHTQPKI
jgi:hypothetical protein